MQALKMSNSMRRLLARHARRHAGHDHRERIEPRMAGQGQVGEGCRAAQSTPRESRRNCFSRKLAILAMAHRQGLLRCRLFD